MNPLAFALPLTLLPGIALLIGSTSARLDKLHDEAERSTSDDAPHRRRLWRRAHLFRIALAALYLAVVLLALAALAGVMLQVVGQPPEYGIAPFTVAGCASLLFGALHLLRETGLTLESIAAHLGDDGAS